MPSATNWTDIQDALSRDSLVNLSPLERNAVSRYAKTLSEVLERRHLRIVVNTDIQQWSRHIIGNRSADGVNPSFNPELHEITSENSFWLSVRDQSAQIVACSAFRVFNVIDFFSLFASMEIFYGRAAPEDRLELIQSPGVPILSGTVGFSGGLWVHPAYRKTGLSGLVFQAGRALAVQRFSVSWDTAIIFEKLAQKRAIRIEYRYQRTVPCFDGFFPPTGKHEKMFIAFSPRMHILASLLEDAEWGIVDSIQNTQSVRL
ncbi:hypothetical protein [Streptomyces sp. NPDC048419]|uniref:hypothetical protein n=1 Tax=Streptomyces sp. NPDC048419 TaxID=3365547 RepID=UPI00371611FB